MISDITRKALNARLAALALLAVCFIPPPAHAREEVSFALNTISWGMVSGQTARFTVFNPNGPLEGGRRPMVFVQVMLFDASGAVIANSDEITIPPGEFRSVDFSFDDLSLAADLAGRVQTRAQVRYKSFFLVDRTRAIGFPTSIELIDAGTGHTTLFVSQEPPQVYVLDTRASQTVVELPVIVYACRPLVGLTDGKTLRVNAFYRERQSGGAVRARVSLYGANGALLAQSAQATIESGGFHSFDFDRAGIPASGEPVGRRLQMRVGLDVATTDPSSFTRDPEATGPVATSLELIDNSTGRTTAVWVTVGFFEVLPPRNPQ